MENFDKNVDARLKARFVQIGADALKDLDESLAAKKAEFAKVEEEHEAKVKATQRNEEESVRRTRDAEAKLAKLSEEIRVKRDVEEAADRRIAAKEAREKQLQRNIEVLEQTAAERAQA